MLSIPAVLTVNETSSQLQEMESPRGCVDGEERAKRPPIDIYHARTCVRPTMTKTASGAQTSMKADASTTRRDGPRDTPRCSRGREGRDLG